MRDLNNALWIELRKAIRSKVPLFTMLGFLILPLASAFLMFVYKNPDFARDMGLISAKANLAGGSADWPFFLGMFAQGISVGGILLFGIIVSWLFGREFSDGTLKDLLAVPVSRGTILAAKFFVFGLWAFLLTTITYLVGLLLAAIIGLPEWTTAHFTEGTATIAVTACLVIIAITPIAFFASVGRGYLMPMGIAIVILALANILAVIGWGDYFPWSIPGMYAGLTGNGGSLQPASLWIVLLTGAAGIFATYLWWKYTDQSR